MKRICYFLLMLLITSHISSQNYAFGFSSPTQYVSINGATDLTPPWTTEMWVKKTSASSGGYSSVMNGYTSKLNLETWASEGKIGVTKYGVADYFVNYALPINTWTHIAYTCDGTKTKVYANGILISSINAVINAPMKQINHSSEGAMAVYDEIRIWNYEKSAGDILAEMNHPIDVSSPNLKAYYKFDNQATVITDSSLKPHNGSNVGGKYILNDNKSFVNSISTMTVLDATTSHENEFIVNPNSINQEVLRIKINTSGSTTPNVLTSISVGSSSTTSLSDVANVKIFYTGRSPIFNTTTLFGTAQSIAQNMIFTGNQTLKEGANYFWVSYDVKSDAVIGNILDASCTHVEILNQNSIVVNPSDPKGNRIIQRVLTPAQSIISIIPKPVSLVQNNGSFIVNSSTKIIVDATTLDEANLFASFLRVATGFPMTIETDGDKTNNISLEILPTYNSVIGDEGYLLNIDSKGISIKANKATGIFYGTQSLRQLFPIEINSKTLVNNVSWNLPYVSIIDYPRFVWRGFHLDVSRHFFNAEYVKKFIDLMAKQKLNVFHWHLIDDQGFRMEIKSHPELTTIGAYMQSSASIYNNGFYTQNQIKDVVEYARKRHVNVMPELESPGHAYSWTKSIPALSCTNAAASIICMGKESTYKVMEDVISEMADLFPYEYVHIGGDEADHTAWTTCPDCQKLMADSTTVAFPLDNNNLHNCQTLYMKRIQRLLAAKGKKVVGWTEMGILNSESVMQDWLGNSAVSTINAGYKAIFSNNSVLYFDSYQGAENEPDTWIQKDYTISDVYNFNPPTKSLSKEKKALALGMEACLWSEKNYNTNLVEYRALPRLYALSEAAWSDEDTKDFSDFIKRLYPRIGELDLLSFNYCPLILPTSEVRSIKGTCSGPVILDSEYGSDYYYWNDVNHGTSSILVVNEPGIYKVYGKCGKNTFTKVYDVSFPLQPTMPLITSSDVGNDKTYVASGNVNTYKWYDSATGGNLLNTGNSCTVPALTDIFVSGVQVEPSNACLSVKDGGYLTFDNSTALNNISNFTYEGWVKIDTWTSWGTLFMKEQSWGSRIGFQLGEFSGELYCLLENGGHTYGFAQNAITLGVWNHVAMVYTGNGSVNSTKLKLYVNGNPVALSYVGVIPTKTSVNNALLQFGSFTGQLSEVRLWAKARTIAEIMRDKNTELIGNEPGLLIYTKLNDGFGQIAVDSKGTSDGIFQNTGKLSWDNVGNLGVVRNGCISDRWSVSKLLSVPETTVNVNISVYPNPNKGCMTVALNFDKIEDYSITWSDVSGRILSFKPQDSSIIGNQLQLNYYGIAKGVYLLSVNGKKTRNTAKILIE